MQPLPAELFKLVLRTLHLIQTFFLVIEASFHTINFYPAFTCSRLTIETLEQDVKYFQS